MTPGGVRASTQLAGHLHGLTGTGLHVGLLGILALMLAGLRCCNLLSKSPGSNQDKPSDVWAQPVFVTKGHVSSSMVFTGRCFSEQLFLSQVPLSGFMLDNSLGSQFAGLATEAQGTSGACPVTQWVRPGLGLEPITWLCDLCSWPALQTASLGASYPLAGASWAGCTPFLFPTHQAYL